MKNLSTKLIFSLITLYTIFSSISFAQATQKDIQHSAKLKPLAASTLNPNLWKNASAIAILKASDSIYAASISSDGKTLAVSGSKFLEIWNLQTQKSKSIFNGTSKSKIPRYVFTSVAISPDGNKLVTHSDGTYIKTRTVKNIPSGCTSNEGTGFFGVSCSLEGRQSTTSTSWRSSGSMQIWDVHQGKLLKTVFNRVHENSTFTPDGKILLTNSPLVGIKVWNTTNGKLITTLNNMFNLSNCAPAVNSVQPQLTASSTGFHPDSEFGIIDMRNGKIKQSLSLPRTVNQSDKNIQEQLRRNLIIYGCLAFSPLMAKCLLVVFLVLFLFGIYLRVN